VLLIHVRTTASCHRKIVANGLGFSDGLRGDHGPSASRGAFADVNQRPCPQGRAPPTDDGQSRDQRLPASKASHRRLIDPNCPVCFGHGGASEILLETFCGHIPLLETADSNGGGCTPRESEGLQGTHPEAFCLFAAKILSLFSAIHIGPPSELFHLDVARRLLARRQSSMCALL
jgi:hypothetical protein